MKSMQRILRYVRRDMTMSVITSFFALAMICGFSEALETSSDSSKNENLSNSYSESSLTNEEIDKIIEDIKISGSIDNILEKLDEIIKRAQLSGNSALQEYASNMKTSYELQKQLDSVNSLIEAMKKKNSGIAAVDSEVKKILSVDTIASDLDGAVSDEALLVLKSLSSDDSKKLQETLAEIESLVDTKDISSLNIQQRSLLDVIILNKIVNENLVEGERLELAKNTLQVAVTILQSYQKQQYPAESYDNLLKESENFSGTGKKAAGIAPEQVVFLNGYFNIKHSPIMYDNHILLSIDDLYQYIDASIEYMYNNATMVITSPDKILEIVAGENVAYLNDKPYNLPVPILSYESSYYMPIEFFATAYDISYISIPEYNFVILYKNLVQLENTSVPNQLNKD